MRAAWLLALACTLVGAAGGNFLVVDVRVNGVARSSTVIWVTQAGEVQARRDVVSGWGLAPGQAPVVLRNAVEYVSLNALPGVRAWVENANLLHVDAAGVAFPGARLNLGEGAALTWESGRGAYLNYDITSLATRGTRPVSGAALEAVVYSDTLSFVTSGVATGTAAGRNFMRYESSLRRDFPESTRTLILGDAVSRAGALVPGLRFGGVSYGTNFATRPEFITFPLPAMSGEARLPTAAELLINGQSRAQIQLPPGPFEISNLPAISGAGEAQLLTRDHLGRQQVLVIPFYVAPSLLKPGLTEAGIELGWLREDFGLRSAEYGRAFARGALRRGFAHDATLDTYAEVAKGKHSAGAGATALIGGFAVANVALIASGGEASGTSLVAALERVANDVSFGLRGEWSTHGFAQLGGIPAVRRRLHANAGLSLGTLGSTALVFAAEAPYDREEGRTYAINYQNQVLRGLSLLMSGSVTRTAGQSRRFAGIVLSMPLDARLHGSLAALRQGSNREQSLDVRQNLPVDDGWASRFRAVSGDAGHVDAGASLLGRQGVWSADVTRSSSSRALRLNASGSIVAAGGLVRPVRQLGDAFAIVMIPGLEGIDVFRQSQRVATTDAMGYAVVTGLRAYEPNAIGVDVLRLTLDTEIRSPVRSVAPARRTGVVLRFDALKTQGALLRAVLEDGSPVPAGATLTTRGKSFPVAAKGEVYVTDIEADADAFIGWNAKRCTLSIPTLAAGQVLQRIGPLTCSELRP